MLGIIGLAVILVAALIVLSVAVHILFSPWLLVVALAVVAWVKFRPRRSHR
jgi:membrane protein implicated in regulation of membrane protease activity